MNVPFPSYCIATGSDFLCRRKEVGELADCLTRGEHILIYDAPKTGKHSLVHAAFDELEARGYAFTPIHFSFLKSRSEASFLSQFSTAAVKALAPSDEEKDAIEQKYLRQRNRHSIISIPESFASETGRNVILILDEFQNILNFDDPTAMLMLMEKVMLSRKNVTCIIMGSRINAMKYIFEDTGFFSNLTTRICLSQVDRDEVMNHINKAFLKVGKVVSKGQLGEIFDKADGNMWYIWDIANTCFLLTRGYVVDAVLKEAFDTVMMQHERRFIDIVYSLSNFQLDLLKAVFDGVNQLNSTDTIEHYNLHSSGNVHRLKEALLKKEVISFDAEHRPFIIDPLFKLWLKERFFNED